MAPKKEMTASEMGRKGGLSRSEKKAKAARRNGLVGAIRRQLKKEFDKRETLGS